MTKISLRAVSIGSLAAVGLAVSALPTFAQEGGRALKASLAGAAEKPTAGDPDGAGAATLRVNVGQGQICYDLQVSGVAAATMAHIHKAPVTDAGPVVAPLTAPSAEGKSSACVTVAQDLAKDILQNPDAYYVNVHNAEFPAGAVRGQLSK
jgi:hypothetical protein